MAYPKTKLVYDVYIRSDASDSMSLISTLPNKKMAEQFVKENMKMHAATLEKTPTYTIPHFYIFSTPELRPPRKKK